MNAHDGTWYNEHGSRMVLEVAPDGRVTGTFESALGLAAPGERFPLTGFATDRLIAFVVDFGKYLSLTTWAGYQTVDEDGEALIDATWQMAVSPPPAKDVERWKGTWTGKNLFRRRPPEEQVLPRRQVARASAGRQAPLSF